jgi:hypothetical protein
MPGADPLKKRLQMSGILLIIGLLIEAACLFSPRPIAFVFFVAVGGLLMFAGMALYLFSLVETPANQ